MAGNMLGALEYEPRIYTDPNNPDSDFYVGLIVTSTETVYDPVSCKTAAAQIAEVKELAQSAKNDAQAAAEGGQAVGEAKSLAQAAQQTADSAAAAASTAQSTADSAAAAASAAQSTADSAAAAASAAMPLSGGTFTGQIIAQDSSTTSKRVRNIQLSTSDLTAGSSSLANGVVYLVYET